MAPTRLLSYLLLLPCVATYRCLNFYGLETEAAKLVCSWKHDPAWYLQKAKEAINIDSIRLPFSYEYVTCSDMQVMDRLIDECAKQNIEVILDYHRGYSTHQGIKPEEQDITTEMWIEILATVMERYQHKPHVKAITLFNEYQGFDINYWENTLSKAVKDLEFLFPGRYEYMLTCYDWAKNCAGLFHTLPVRAKFEIHVYGFTAYGPTDYEIKFPAISPDKIFVGEIGWRNNETSWFQNFKTFAKRHKLQHMCLWTLAHSDDTDNLFMNDCETINDKTKAEFNSLWDRPSCLRKNGH